MKPTIVIPNSGSKPSRNASMESIVRCSGDCPSDCKGEGENSMRRGNQSGSNGQSLSAAPVTAHTYKPHVYVRASLIDQVRANKTAGLPAVRYPQDSTTQSNGQVVNKSA